MPQFCRAEFEKVVVVQSKPQRVLRAIDLLHSALMGKRHIPEKMTNGGKFHQPRPLVFAHPHPSRWSP